MFDRTYMPPPFRARAECSAALITLILVSACTDTGTSAGASRGFLSEGELLATLPGNTVRSVSGNGTEWSQTYSAPDGTGTGSVRGSFGEEPIEAIWSVDGSEWCEDWGSGNACFTFQRVSDTQLRAFEDGVARPNLWTVL